MKRLTEPNYKQTFYTLVLPFEQNITYYWYVIPHLKTDEGSLTGYCSQGVAYFDFGDPIKEYKISLTLETNAISIEPNNMKVIYFIVKNLGNQKTTVDISVTIDKDGEEFITPSLPVRTSIIPVSSNVNFTLNILVLANAELKTYNLTVKATAMESTVVSAQETLTIKVGKDGVNGRPDGKEDDEAIDNSLLIGGVLIIIIVIILIIVALLFLKKKKTEEVKKEEAFSTERVGEPSLSVSPGVGPIAATTTAQAPQIKVSVTQVQQVPSAAPTPSLPPVGKVEPIAKPVAAKPVAAKPVAAKPVAAKPVAAKPVAAKPVAAKPISTPTAPVPAKPIAATPKSTTPVAAQPIKAQPEKPQTTKSESNSSTTKEAEKK
jgi:hypothetical protein